MGEFRFDGAWVVTADPEDVWAVVAHPHAWTGWWDAIDRVDTVGDWHDGGHAELVFRTPIGREVSTRIRADELDPPRRLRFSGGGAFAGDGTIEVTSVDRGAHVAYDLRFRTTRFWLMPIEPILRHAARAGGDAAMREAGERLAEMAGGRLEAFEH